MYAVILLSGDGEYDKSGFASEQEAEDYIFEFLCDSCQQAVKDGGFPYKHRDEAEEWYEITNPLQTSCGAEWAMMADEEYEDICKSSETGDLSEPQEYLTRQYEKYKVDKDNMPV
jgi:hypothetical protein